MNDFCTVLLDPRVGPRCGNSMPCPNPEHDPMYRHRKNPVYYKDGEMMVKTKEELIAELRHEITTIRGKIWDIYMGFGWKDRLDSAEHTLTLVISYLYHALEEMEKTNKHWKDIEEKERLRKMMPPGGV